jgi:hypothetical protein
VDTYKCQKQFLRRLGTYKCQSELVADQKLNKITSKSQTQKLAKKKPQNFIVGGEKLRLPINVKNGF